MIHRKDSFFFFSNSQIDSILFWHKLLLLVTKAFLNFFYLLKFLRPRNHRHVTSSAGRTDGHSQQSLLSPQPGLLFPAYSIFLSDGIEIWLPALRPMCSICSVPTPVIRPAQPCRRCQILVIYDVQNALLFC